MCSCVPASLTPQPNYHTKHKVFLSTYTLVCLPVALRMRTVVPSIVGLCQQHTFQSTNALPLLCSVTVGSSTCCYLDLHSLPLGLVTPYPPFNYHLLSLSLSHCSDTLTGLLSFSHTLNTTNAPQPNASHVYRITSWLQVSRNTGRSVRQQLCHFSTSASSRPGTGPKPLLLLKWVAWLTNVEHSKILFLHKHWKNNTSPAPKVSQNTSVRTLIRFEGLIYLNGAALILPASSVRVSKCCCPQEAWSPMF